MNICLKKSFLKQEVLNYVILLNGYSILGRSEVLQAFAVDVESEAHS